MSTYESRPGSSHAPQTLGIGATYGRKKWVQTERTAHEAWARLAVLNPSAAALLHTLVARMDDRNALVVSRKTLAALMGCSEATVKRSTKALLQARWIDVVQVGGKGGVNAYLVNSTVAWGQKRENLHLASFSATVLANAEEQDAPLEHRELRRIPVLVPGEALQ